MKKIIALMLALLMVFAMTACGGETATTETAAIEEKGITGTWSYDFDVIDDLLDSMGSMDGLEDYVKIDSFVIRILLTFNEDGTYAITIDEDHLRAGAEDLIDSMKEGAKAYFAQTLKDSGVDMSVEDAMAMAGVDLDTMFTADMIMDEIDTTDISAGQYKFENDTLYSSQDVNEAPDMNEGEACTVSGDSLTLSGLSGVEGTPLEGLESVTFTRVK